MHIFPEEDQALYLDPDLYRSHDWTIPDFWNSCPDWSLSAQRQELFTQVILNALSGGPQTREQLKDLCRTQGMTPAEEGSPASHPQGGASASCVSEAFSTTPSGRSIGKPSVCPGLSCPCPGKNRLCPGSKEPFVHTCPTTVHDLMYFFRAF